MKPAVALSWAAFTAWCVAGFAPCVDLPAHAAQMETLAQLVRGNASVAELYRVTFPIGYGLDYWLFLPLALLTNGATALRASLWLALQLYPLSALVLMRTFKRPDWYVLLSLPLAFNISYWYGLVPGLLAQPLVYFSVALFAKALDDPRRRWLVLLNLAAGAAMLTHLLAFAAGVAVLAAWSLAHAQRFRAVRTLALGLSLPAVLSVPKVVAMATRAVTPGDWPETTYAFASHFAWFFQNYRPEGLLAVAAPLTVSTVFVGLYLWRRRLEPRGPAVIFFAMLLVYFATPKTLSGIFLVSTRLPVLAGMFSLLLVSKEAIGPRLRALLVTLSVLSLAESAVWHWRFARAVDGLEVMIEEPPINRHGYVSLVGRGVLRSKHVYLDHLGQWWTAKQGKIGHNFFADADHHPVRFRGAPVPADLWSMEPSDLAFFDEILVFGDVELPEALKGWQVSARAGAWRKVRKQ